METYKSPIRNKISLFNEKSPSKRKINNKRRYYSNSNLSLMKYKIKNRSKNLCLNVIDFIKKKNRFFIEDSFDIRGTREFLASKEVAMRKIKLNDEIEPEKEDRIISKTNKNLENLKFMNGNENKYFEKIKKSGNISSNNTISPRKTKRIHNKNMNKEFNSEIKEISNKKSKKIKNSSKNTKYKTNTAKSKVDSSILDLYSNNSNKKENIIFHKLSNDSHSKIYKLFIDNTNEPDEHFHKKLKKELNKVENSKQKKDKDKNGNIKRKSLSRKDLNYKSPEVMNCLKYRDTQSIFMFSELNKQLMMNDGLEISSIGEHNNINIQSTPNNKFNKKNLKKVYSSIKMNNKRIKKRIQEKMTYDLKEEKEKIYNILYKKELKSDKDSIMSILSDLM